jgi:hypothetical protein
MMTPRSIALCLEDTAITDATTPRYLQCVALPGNQRGLALDLHGNAHFADQALTAAEIACELWVSADEQLMLFVPQKSSAKTRIERAGRSLVAPAEKPVVLRDGDELFIGSAPASADERQLKLHLHGFTDHVHEPTAFVPSQPRKISKVAAAVALGAAVGLAGVPASATTQPMPSDGDSIEVRVAPPKPMPPKKPPKKPKDKDKGKDGKDKGKDKS